VNIFEKWIIKDFIAHRGLHTDKEPENSIGAFLNAIKKGYPIELDVRIIDDGTLIVFHDAKLGRMTGDDGYACNLKRDDLKDLRLNKTEYTIPTLEEALAAIDGKVPVVIEIKNECKAGPLEKKLLEILKEYSGEYAVQSFNPYSLEFFRVFAPHIMRGQLSCSFKGEKLAWYKKFFLKRMFMNKTTKPDFIAYKFSDLPNRFVKKYQDKGLPLLAWTIRSDADYELVKQYCDNIIFEGFEPQKS